MYLLRSTWYLETVVRNTWSVCRLPQYELRTTDYKLQTIGIGPRTVMQGDIEDKIRRVPQYELFSLGTPPPCTPPLSVGLD